MTLVNSINSGQLLDATASPTFDALTLTSATVYAPVCGGTSSATPLQSADTGISNSGYVLTSTGAASLPSWQAPGSGSGTTIGPYIVGPTNSDYTDIQSAINAAVTAGASTTSPATIYIQSGTYNITASYTFNFFGLQSNCLVLEDGITLVGVTESISGVSGGSSSILPVTINADYVVFDNQGGLVGTPTTNGLQNINFTPTTLSHTFITGTDYPYGGQSLVSTANIMGCNGGQIGGGQSNIVQNSFNFYINNCNINSINFQSNVPLASTISINNSTCTSVFIVSNVGPPYIGQFTASGCVFTSGVTIQFFSEAVFQNCTISAISSMANTSLSLYNSTISGFNVSDAITSIVSVGCNFTTFSLTAIQTLSETNFQDCNFSGYFSLNSSNNNDSFITGCIFNDTFSLDTTSLFIVQSCVFTSSTAFSTAAAYAGGTPVMYVGSCTFINGNTEIDYTKAYFYNCNFAAGLSITSASSFSSLGYDFYNCSFFGSVGTTGGLGYPSLGGMFDCYISGNLNISSSDTVPLHSMYLFGSLTLAYDGSNPCIYAIDASSISGPIVLDGICSANIATTSFTDGITTNGSAVTYYNCYDASVELNTAPMTIGAYTLPNTDGSADQVLQTDGSGGVTWENLGTFPVLQTAPTDSHTATTGFGSLSIGTALQNTLGYDILVNVSVAATAATGATIVMGVGPTNTPTTDAITASFSIITVAVTTSFSAIVPTGYYLLVNTTGTITVGSVQTQVCPI